MSRWWHGMRRVRRVSACAPIAWCAGLPNRRQTPARTRRAHIGAPASPLTHVCDAKRARLLSRTPFPSLLKSSPLAAITRVEEAYGDAFVIWDDPLSPAEAPPAPHARRSRHARAVRPRAR